MKLYKDEETLTQVLLVIVMLLDYYAVNYLQFEKNL